MSANVRAQQGTLLDLLDRLLNKGVVVKGEIAISIAEVDLIYLRLDLLLSSIGGASAIADKDLSILTSPVNKIMDGIQ